MPLNGEEHVCRPPSFATLLLQAFRRIRAALATRCGAKQRACMQIPRESCSKTANVLRECGALQSCSMSRLLLTSNYAFSAML
jgi:hypothetical protein